DATLTLPFSWFYMHCEAIRFFRVPARFGLGLQWVFAIGAAAGLNALRRTYCKTGHAQRAQVATAVILTFAAIDYFPMVTTPKIDCRPKHLTQFLKTDTEQTPFVLFPFSPERDMA